MKTPIKIMLSSTLFFALLGNPSLAADGSSDVPVAPNTSVTQVSAMPEPSQTPTIAPEAPVPSTTPTPPVIPNLTPPPRMYLKSDGQGTTYNGEMKNSQIDGYAIVTYSDGKMFTGELHGYQPNGPGVMSFPDGTKFEGTFLEGGPLNGKLTLNDSFSSFEGTFDNTLPVIQAAVHALGKTKRQATVNGKVVDTVWAGIFFGENLKRGTINFTSNSVFKGYTATNPAHIESVYFGYFHPIGMGSITNESGDIFYGKWRYDEANGDIHAIGSIKLKNGKVKAAKWFNGNWKISTK